MSIKNTRVYEFIVIIISVLTLIILSLYNTVSYPGIYELLFFLFVSMMAAYFYITIEGTIVSFDIAIFYFLLLSFGPLTAGWSSFVAIIAVWSIHTYRELITYGKKPGLNTLRMGLYNAGMYALIYIAGGYIYRYLSMNFNQVTGMILTIPAVVVINEMFFSINKIFEGSGYLDYLKREGLRSNLLEFAVYPFGIAMFLLYENHNFWAVFPLMIGIILLTYLGRLMSDYEHRLLERLSDFGKLNEISRKFTEIFHLEELIKAILKEIYSILDLDSCSIYFMDRVDKKCTYYTYDGNEMEKSVCEHNAEFDSKNKFILEDGMDSFGFLRVDRKEKLENGEVAVLQNITKQASISLSNAIMYRISIKDPLTGLYTRRHFEQKMKEELSRSDRTGKKFVLLMFDIDRFKIINDNFGHTEGDKVLKRFASVLNKFTRPFDFSSRWGGDEFILVLPETDSTQAQKIAERILDEFSRKIQLKNRTIKPSATYATTEYSSELNLKSEELFYRVDQELIKNKKRKFKDI